MATNQQLHNQTQLNRSDHPTVSAIASHHSLTSESNNVEPKIKLPFKRVSEKFASVKASMAERLHPNTMKRIDDIEKRIISDYMVVSSSFDEYCTNRTVHRKSNRRYLISWLPVYGGWPALALASCVIGMNNRDLYLLFGSPLTIIPNVQLAIVTILICAYFGIFSRTLTLIIERKPKLEVLNIARSLQNERERGKLTVKHYLKFAKHVEIIASSTYFFYFLDLILTIPIIGLVVYAYITPEEMAPFRYLMIFWCIIVAPAAWIIISVYYAGYATYVLPVIYLKYRFKQLYETIEKINSNLNANQQLNALILMGVVRDHNEICSINTGNNHLAKWILFETYYVGSVLLDFCLILGFYGDKHWLVKTVFFLGSFYVVILIFSMANVSAALSVASKSPYSRLNSIMARLSGSNAIPIDVKWKINNMIERIGQQEITVWCLDLFPLNSYEFYLFVASVASNFFLFVDLTEASQSYY